jgi:hypothetical protein
LRSEGVSGLSKAEEEALQVHGLLNL